MQASLEGRQRFPTTGTFGHIDGHNSASQDVERPAELRAVHRRNGRAYQRGRVCKILPLEAEGTAGLARRHGRAALRGISRALALQQGYMLAPIDDKIQAPVLASYV